MKNYIYTSVLKDEFNSFLALRSSQGYKDKNRFVLESLDKYLTESNQREKRISSFTAEKWISETCKNLSNGSTEQYMSFYNIFARYLSTIGIDAHILVFPCNLRERRYTPYIFSSDEIEKIFAIADSGVSTRDKLSKIQIPMCLRLLYGCGLRVGEVLSMHLSNVDLKAGTLLIQNGKGNKDRIVPMDHTLTDILTDYCSVLFADRYDDPYLFESNYKDGLRNCVGHARSTNWVFANFKRILKTAGITYETHTKHERGICPHCLRHTFAVHSYRNQSKRGIDNYRVLPLISVYLGHNSLLETQAYIHLTAENASDIIDLTSNHYKGMFPEVPR